MAASPDAALGDARAALDRGDGRSALKQLDRARRGYAKRRDAEGLEHVLDMSALVEPADDRTRIGRDNLAYAVKQNLRQESRRAARQQKEPWTDPYPDLQAPTEHTGLALTRGVKIAIAVGVVVAVAAFAGIVVAIALTDTTETVVTVRLVNDTGRKVTVRSCDDAGCTTTFTSATVEPGESTQSDVDAARLVQSFRIDQPGADECLPLRIRDAYLRLGRSGRALAAKLSQATPCPGTTVLPKPSPDAETPL